MIRKLIIIVPSLVILILTASASFLLSDKIISRIKASLIYGPQAVSYVLRKTNEPDWAVQCLLSPANNTLWGIHHIIIRYDAGHSGAFASDKQDPYKDHFLVSKTDRENENNPLYNLIKDRIEKVAKGTGDISNIHSIRFYSFEKARQVSKNKLLERDNPDTIHIKIYSYRDTEVINSNKITLEFLFYRPRNFSSPLLQKSAPLPLDLNDSDEVNKDKIMKTIDAQLSRINFTTCSNKVYLGMMNCF